CHRLLTFLIFTSPCLHIIPVDDEALGFSDLPRGRFVKLHRPGGSRPCLNERTGGPHCECRCSSLSPVLWRTHARHRGPSVKSDHLIRGECRLALVNYPSFTAAC